MFRKLLIVFASGLILSVMAFGAAWVAGGEKLRKEIAEGHGWSWTIGEDEDDTGGKHRGANKKRIARRRGRSLTHRGESHHQTWARFVA